MNLNPFKGFRQPKKLTNAQKEKQAKAQEFAEKYKALCAETHLQLMPIIKQEANGGFKPDMVVTDYQPPVLKNWADAQEENLKVQQTCRHLNENNTNCKHCGVRIADQKPDGTGVTEDFILTKNARIKEFRIKETEHNKEAH